MLTSKNSHDILNEISDCRLLHQNLQQDLFCWNFVLGHLGIELKPTWLCSKRTKIRSLWCILPCMRLLTCYFLFKRTERKIKLYLSNIQHTIIGFFFNSCHHPNFHFLYMWHFSNLTFSLVAWVWNFIHFCKKKKSSENIIRYLLCLLKSIY